MTVYKAVIVKCNRCGHQMQCPKVGDNRVIQTITAARMYLHKIGWVTFANGDGGGDLCPKCVNEHEQESEA